MSESGNAVSRRPLKSRSSPWARMLAGFLGRLGVAPNAISFASVVFAVIGAGAMLSTMDMRVPAWVGWTAGAFCIQLRLGCNLLDGMVAVEGNRRSPTGELWNEIPDRIADALFLIAAGIASGAPWLGVAAALGALLTAYIRALGASVTGEQDFAGPMAKPHRMALLTLAALITPWFADIPIMPVALALMTLGIVATCVVRITTLRRKLIERHVP